MFSGCQFSLYPMSDNFVEVILPAVKAMGNPEDLRIETDDISTLVVGQPERVFEVVAKAYEAACRAGKHVVLSALFSRGCPGEPDDPLCTPEGPSKGVHEGARQDAGADSATRGAGTSSIATTGVEIDAQFSLYPLGIAEYMTTIASTVRAVKKAGVYDRSKNFCTRLSGDLSAVFAAVERAFDEAARDTGHVVIHLTASKGSPSKKQNSDSM
ncbi:MAG: Ykof family thiamine-binding protein [Spirochaeta sp.]|nr:Ykof family thiamine-binding protein [Spirochaeta sp.]